MADDSDVELMTRLSEKDPHALEEIYVRYSRVVYCVCLRITRNQSTAEDLAQDVFLRLWHRAGDFDAGKGSTAVWILSVARNMAIDHLRTSHARFVIRLDPVESRLHSHGQGLYDYCEVAFNSSLVGRSLSSLTYNQRQALELSYYEGMSQSEISKRLKVPLGTVKGWMRAGLSRLRRTMVLEPLAS